MRQVDEFGTAFRKIDDAYLRDRGADLRDIGRRVIQKLLPSQQTPWDLKEAMILVSSELTPSDTVRLDREKVLAFATESGGKESHAAILADQLAREVDFFSIGTNDLTQYTLAVDRDNDLVNHIYEPLNPAVLRLIRMIARVAKDAGKQVTLCGEMAGTPAYIPLLVGIGLADLSMNPSSLLEAKKIIRNTEYGYWQSVASDAFDLSSVEEINRLIASENERIGLQFQAGPIK
jgi:phosphoenolpyruvate-protein kinase (PTS system EI component)